MPEIFGNENDKTGLLLNANNIKIQRQYFREALKLLGIKVLYRSPKNGTKEYTTYGEMDAAYNEPILVGAMFHQHPNQYTMRKLGWVTELNEDASLIEVDYDLPNLQVGSLFIIPTGVDGGEGRLFRVTRMMNSAVYPVSITCEIVPEYISTYDEVMSTDFQNTSYNLLNREESETGESYSIDTLNIEEY